MRTRAAKKSAEQAVVVTTEHRGVFFGYAVDVDGPTIELKRARNCVYWGRDVKGFMGLAAGGPTSSCRACDVAGFNRAFPDGAEWPTDVERASAAGLNVRWAERRLGLMRGP